MIDWEQYKPFFKPMEFMCKHCGVERMEPEFIDRLFTLRKEWKRPMIFSSAYRCAKHPQEAVKAIPGSHTTGRAADVVTQGKDAAALVQLAMGLGFTGFGISQKGHIGRFIHLDDMPESVNRPMIWSY